MLRQAGLLAPGLPAAPPAGISSVGFPTATRALVPTVIARYNASPRTVTSIPYPRRLSRSPPTSATGLRGSRARSGLGMSRR